MKRVILIVLDSLGIGEMPDAGEFGDKGSHTFKHVYEECKGLKIPNLIKLGMANIEGADINQAIENPNGAFGKPFG